jgi:hypothetical protein
MLPRNNFHNLFFEVGLKFVRQKITFCELCLFSVGNIKSHEVQLIMFSFGASFYLKAQSTLKISTILKENYTKHIRSFSLGIRVYIKYEGKLTVAYFINAFIGIVKEKNISRICYITDPNKCPH